MKYKHKLEKLAARIKDWDNSKGQNQYSGHLHTRPGSQKK